MLGDGKVSRGDLSLINNSSTEFYPILKALKKLSDRCFIIKHVDTIEYIAKNIIVKDFRLSEELLNIPASKFLKEASNMLDGIQKGKGSSFSIPNSSIFLEYLGIRNFKSGANSKSDLDMVIFEKDVFKNKYKYFPINIQFFLW